MTNKFSEWLLVLVHILCIALQIFILINPNFSNEIVYSRHDTYFVYGKFPFLFFPPLHLLIYFASYGIFKLNYKKLFFKLIGLTLLTVFTLIFGIMLIEYLDIVKQAQQLLSYSDQLPDEYINTQELERLGQPDIYLLYIPAIGLACFAFTFLIRLIFVATGLISGKQFSSKKNVTE